MRELCRKCMALFVCKKEGQMGKILAIAGGIPTGILLAALTGCMLAIQKVREKQQQDMQNEKGGGHG